MENEEYRFLYFKNVVKLQLISFMKIMHLRLLQIL